MTKQGLNNKLYAIDNGFTSPYEAAKAIFPNAKVYGSENAASVTVMDGNLVCRINKTYSIRDGRNVLTAEM